MKILLVAVNAKYIHSCPAVYSLKAYADKYKTGNEEIEISEYTINDRYGDILSDIVLKNADVVAFATYIWNVDRVLKLISDIRKIRDNTIQIWVGGPESTNSPEKFLLESSVDICLQGEGEEIFKNLCDYTERIWRRGNTENTSVLESSADVKQNGCERLADIRGLAYRDEEHPDQIHETGFGEIVQMDKIPFLYEDLSLFDNRIIYYESSRGCPFNCSYCLSSIDRKMRFRNIDVVKKELQFFLDNNVKQVKFVDRTFNCDKNHAMEIWKYINEHDNGVTNFHFEIEAGLMTDEQIAYVNTLRTGLIQMEIGIQSTNEETLRLVNRKYEIDKIEHVVAGIRKGENVNLHLDLIAGLPLEDMEIFQKSFNRVYAMRPNQFQLGFLKVLNGTEIAARSEEFGIVSSTDSPYQVLKTKWMSFEDLIQLEKISDMIETFYNSQFFIRSLPFIEEQFETPFEMYQKLSDYFVGEGYHIRQPSAQKRYDILKDFVHHITEDEEIRRRIDTYIDFDKCLHFNKSRRMEYTAEFELADGKKTYHFDYSKRNLVNSEASFEVL